MTKRDKDAERVGPFGHTERAARCVSAAHVVSDLRGDSRQKAITVYLINPASLAGFEDALSPLVAARYRPPRSGRIETPSGRASDRGDGDRDDGRSPSSMRDGDARVLDALAAGVLLRLACGVEDDVQLVIGRFGKPSLRERPPILLRNSSRRLLHNPASAIRDLIDAVSPAPCSKVCPESLLEGDGGGAGYFSLSHTEGMVGLAAADFEVGLDIERISALPSIATLLAVAERFFPAADFARIATAPPEEAPLLFARSWTRLEAVLKAEGRGFTEEGAWPKELPNTLCCETECCSDVMVSCAANAPFRLRCVVLSDTPSGWYARAEGAEAKRG